MKTLLWKHLAKFLARPAIAQWPIYRAQQTPYRHLLDPDGSVYMNRYWLFNAYPDEREGTAALKRYYKWLPSIRLHQIMREDRDRHLHDHPWEARTIVLRGWYIEQRLQHPTETARWSVTVNGEFVTMHHRLAGDTAPLSSDLFHSITAVSPGGAWTLFITWKYQAAWGFLVDGKKIPYRKYLNLPENPSSN